MEEQYHARAELLAPAGSMDALRAAVQNGADAVYLGQSDFSARQSAKNFTDEELQKAILLCHAYGVRVYLALNTLVSDREIARACAVAVQACRMGIDAVLIQDWGLWQLLRHMLPDLPLHGSTQMSIFTSGGCAILAGEGCRRVVLARECSRKDVETICQNTLIETEVFAHGALCMCYSGQCTFSAVLGGRSGNRGRCAQPCRLPYGVDAPAKNQYPLSLKDLCLADTLGDIPGVACWKLEGRMRRPEYTAIVTRIYASILREKRGLSAQERNDLQQAFSRNGFTDGYWLGKTGSFMCGTRPENTKEPEKLFAAVKTAYERGNLRTVPLVMSVCVHRDTPAKLTVTDDAGRRISVSGAIPEPARTRPLQRDDLAARLRKTGGTVYRCEQVEIKLDENLSLSAAQINSLRRDALAKLDKARTDIPPRREYPALELPEDIHRCSHAPRFTVSVRTWEQAEVLAPFHPARIYLPLEEFARYMGLTSSRSLWPRSAVSGKRINHGVNHINHSRMLDNIRSIDDIEWAVILPRVWRDSDEPELHLWLTCARQAGISMLLIGNIGGLPLAQGCAMQPVGDFGLNIFNSYALDWLRKKGLYSACVSFELRLSQIRDLHMSLPVEAIVYGRLPLMITENCLIQNQAGCCCDKRHVLQDRTGAEFPLLSAYGHRTELENSLPLWLADTQEYQTSGLTFARLRFTIESPAACAEIYRAYLAGKPYLAGKSTGNQFTRGLYYRGVD